MPAKRPFAIVFIHGLARKPPPDKLREIWLWGLARENPMPSVFAPPNKGVDLNSMSIPQRFNYYADVFYGIAYETELDSYYEANENSDSEIEVESLDKFEPELNPPHPVTPRERAFIENLEAKLKANPVLATTALEPSSAASRRDYEIASWLPSPVKEAIIKKAAMEAFYFLFNKEYLRSDGTRFMVRQELRSRLLKDLSAAQLQAEKIVIVSHSMGTMVAYDVLRNCPECPAVNTLFTLGSPLGIREVQDELIAMDASDVDFPAAKLEHWINVYDPLDPVCGADPKLDNDYHPVNGRAVQDIRESNWGNWRHTITHYFAGNRFRDRLRAAVGREQDGY